MHRLIQALIAAAILWALPWAADAAFPVVVSTATSENATDVLSHTVVLPPGRVAGNRIVLFITVDADTTIDVGPSGFTKIAVQGEGVTAGTVWVYEKRNITGAEAGTLTFHTVIAETSVHRAYQISGDDKTVAAQFSGLAVGNSAAPDPPSLTPTWGLDDTLWLLGISFTDDTNVVSAWPTGYGSTGLESSSVGGAGSVLGWATRSNTTATENPSVMTVSASANSRIMLLGIKPGVAPPPPTAITYIGTGTRCEQNSATCVPTLHASTQAGDLAVCYDYYRTGNVQPVAAGWTNSLSWGVNNEATVLTKIVTGPGDNPSITIAGGTGTSHIASCATFRGTLNTTTGLIAHSNTDTNNATQDVHYPGVTITTPNTLVCLLGRKNDDWTGVATVGGYTEVIDTSTTLGSDAGIVMDCQVQTTATNVSGSDFIVTGGTSQPNGGAVISIKPSVGVCSAPTVTDVGGDEIFNGLATNVIYTVTNGCPPGTVTLEQASNVRTLSQDSYTDTGGQVDISGVGWGVVNGLLYGDADFCVTNVNSLKGCLAVTLTRPAGSIYNNLTEVALLFWNDYGSPSRIYGNPLDLQPDSQVALSGAVGCTLDPTDEGAVDPALEDDIWIKPDGSLRASALCTSVNVDFSRDGLYIGVVKNIKLIGAPPQWAGIDVPDQVFARNLPLVSYDLDNYFVLGEAGVSGYSLKQLITPVAVTNTNGAGTNSIFMIVESVVGIAVDDWLKVGAGVGGVYSRVKFIDPFTKTIGLWTPISWIDNDQVSTMSVNGVNITGVSIDPTTHVFGGTPTAVQSFPLSVIRLTDLAGQIADSP